MSNVSEFSTTAASNNSAAPNGFPEGMSPASLNDSARELMAALAKWYKDQQGTITTGGTTTAYTLTSNNAHAALDDIGLFAFQVNATNTGAATLNVDSLGAKSMNLNGAALGAGDIVADEIVLAVYNPDNDVFDLFKSGLSQSTILANTINELTSGNGVTIDSVSLKDGGITVGATIVSDTDSTDDLGTTSVRWANVYTDSIGDTGQDLTVAATTVNFPSGGVFDFNGGDITLTHSANTLTFNGGTLALGANALTGSGTVTLSGGGSLTGTWSDLGSVTTVDINGGTVDGSVIGGASAAAGTFTNLTASTDLTLASGATVTAILDEDAMGSDSATALATQQSIKKYVDDTLVAIGALSVSGTPVANDFARFTGAATIEGRSYAETRSDLGLEIGTDVQAEISGASLTSATVATGDKVLVQDVDDSDNLKTVTAQSIADLAAAETIDNYLTGLTLSNGTDGDHDIDVAVGIATDSTNAEYLELSSAITKQIDATWASGTGAGGRSSSVSLSTDTWYHVFLVKIAGSVDVLFDTDIDCSNGVTDHSVTAYRRIGSVLTNGSSNIRPFLQVSDRFIWDVMELDYSSNITSTAALITFPTPDDVKCLALFVARENDGDFAGVLFTDPDTTDTAADNDLLSIVSSSSENSSYLEVFTNTSSQVRGRANGTIGMRIFVMGYEDSRGKQ